MATFAISLSFTAGAKDHNVAYELAERIGNYIVQEEMAKEFSVIDIELVDDDELTEEFFDEEDE